MGGSIFLIILLTVIMMVILSLFREWYALFLRRRNVDGNLSVLLIRLTLLILAFLFWEALIAHGGLRTVDASHFYLSLFAFALVLFLRTFGRGK
ncbi:hypothetical protein JXO52_11575 [bacterium]|nr:hypothetical protein [bacterium]